MGQHRQKLIFDSVGAIGCFSCGLLTGKELFSFCLNAFLLSDIEYSADKALGIVGSIKVSLSSCCNPPFNPILNPNRAIFYVG
ncbi:hypothetical protein [Nostoc sp.]|uniref:hypothetical protein n=1 Tax=Nostoc sp. TaxID=1180 RepID=UPI003FA52FA5